MNPTAQRPTSQLRWQWQDDHPWSAPIQLGLFLRLLFLWYLPLIGLSLFLSAHGLSLKSGESSPFIAFVICLPYSFNGIRFLKRSLGLDLGSAQIIDRKTAFASGFDFEAEAIAGGDLRAYTRNVKVFAIGLPAAWALLCLLHFLIYGVFRKDCSSAFVILAASANLNAVVILFTCFAPLTFMLLPYRIEAHGVTWRITRSF